MSIFFVIISAVLLASAIGVVGCKNPIYSALCLVVNLVGVAALYAMLEAHFLAAVQIIVYAGAIMVLVVFVIMLLNLKDEDQRPGGLVLLGLVIAGGAVFCGSIITLLYVQYSYPDAGGVLGTSQVEAVVGSAGNIGRLLYSKYVFPFEAASALIMAAIVGAAMLAKRSTAPKVEG
jgi:NADH-quinone oxidoreductase subunit J